MDLHAKEIDELLKRGAYDVFREDDAEVAPSRPLSTPLNPSQPLSTPLV